MLYIEPLGNRCQDRRNGLGGLWRKIKWRTHHKRRWEESVNLSAGLAPMKVKEKEGALERKNLKWQCSSESQGQRLGAPEWILLRAMSSLSLTPAVLSPWRNPAQESVMSACTLQQIPKVQELGATTKFSLQQQVLSWREIWVPHPHGCYEDRPKSA